MKVLDVQPFQEGLQRNIETLEGIAQLMQAIEKVMTELVSINDTWKGEDGDAIRAFYEECHLPFLKFFSIFNNNFVSSIQQIMKAQTSLEPYNSGYINEGFIEEVKVGLQRIERNTANLTDETNGIMDSVSDIVSLPHLDDAEVQEGIRRARRKSDDTIAGLQEFDLNQTAILTTVANDLRVMERWIDDVESMMVAGLSDVDFPVEPWKVVTSSHPLHLSLANNSSEGVTGISSNYGVISKEQHVPQQYLPGIGLDSAFVPTAGQRIANELYPMAAGQIENGSSDHAWEDIGTGIWGAGKWLADFLLLDSLRTIFNPESNMIDRGVAVAEFFPVGKVFKAAKMADEIPNLKKAEGVIEETNNKAEVIRDNNNHIRNDNNKEVNVQGREISNLNIDEAKEVLIKRLQNGEISIEDLKSLIPKSSTNSFLPSERIKEGEKYTFTLSDGKKAIIRWHSPDIGLKEMYPDSNSANRWTAQITFGKRSLGTDGEWHRNTSLNKVHIPIKGK